MRAKSSVAFVPVLRKDSTLNIQQKSFVPTAWQPNIIHHHSRLSLRHALPRPKAPGPTSVIALAALLVGFLVGRLSSGKRQRLSNVSAEEGSFAMRDIVDPQEEGATPLWLNFALARMWALFQKNTKRLITDVIQPVLDTTEKPKFVTEVRVKKFVPGRQSPFLKSLRRLPSRALAEVQYSVQTVFSSTSTVDFDVNVEIGKLAFTIPVVLRDMDVDARCWLSLNLAPFDPYITSVQYSLLETPNISFDMTVAGVIPITALPVLRSFFFRVVTQEIPKEFLFPKTVELDFTPETINATRAHLQEESMERMDQMTEEQLIDTHPEQWAIFDAIDLDNSGCLSGVELFTGLQDWGYTAEDASESFTKLDLNADNKVTFREFCHIWPSLADSFVPSRYKGALTVYLRRAENIRQPLFGMSDPYVRLRLNQQEKESKTCDSGEGTTQGNPIWLETFDLNCIDPSNEELEVSVMEGSRWHFPPTKNEIAKATVSLEGLMKRPNQKIKVKLEPQGSVWLDLSYADFVTSTKVIKTTIT